MRGKPAKKSPLELDQIYRSSSVTRLINKVMLHGKKSVAESTVYNALEIISADRKEALNFYMEALKNVMPKQEVRSRRVGGATYQVPFPVKHERAEALAVRWIVESARGKKGKPMMESLVDELKNAKDGVGEAIKQRDETHRMAEANKAFAHFRF